MNYFLIEIVHVEICVIIKQLKRRIHMKLRPLKMDDYGNVLRWSRDDIFCLANGWETNRKEAELYKWWHSVVTTSKDDFLRLGIEYKEQLIGYADLAHIKNCTAEIGIAIGDSILWGKGIGVQSVRCLMDYAVKELGITTFTAETNETNIRSRKMLEKVGFTEVSRIGKEVYVGEEGQLIQYKFIYTGVIG
jgi:[ribosomal protein S5]-alanine N-acetyltransferase